MPLSKNQQKRFDNEVCIICENGLATKLYCRTCADKKNDAVKKFKENNPERRKQQTALWKRNNPAKVKAWAQSPNRKAYEKQYYSNNRERIIQRVCEYERDPLRMVFRREYYKKRREENRDYLRSYFKSWIDKNRDRYNEYHRDYYYRNRDRILSAAREIYKLKPRVAVRRARYQRTPISVFYPFNLPEQGSGADLVLRVNRIVSQQANMPEDIRADICQELILKILTGEITEDQIADNIPFVFKVQRKFMPTKFVTSIDGLDDWQVDRLELKINKDYR